VPEPVALPAEHDAGVLVRRRVERHVHAEERELQQSDHREDRHETEPFLLAPGIQQRNGSRQRLEHEPRVRGPAAVRSLERDDRRGGSCEREVRIEPLEPSHGGDPSRG
jgi:hypothetical protein